jgi:hypothetical protein
LGEADDALVAGAPVLFVDDTAGLGEIIGEGTQAAVTKANEREASRQLFLKKVGLSMG